MCCDALYIRAHSAHLAAESHLAKHDRLLIDGAVLKTGNDRHDQSQIDRRLTDLHTVIAFRVPKCEVNEIEGYHVYAAHSDSPAFKIKENPEIEKPMILIPSIVSIPSTFTLGMITVSYPSFFASWTRCCVWNPETPDDGNGL